MRKKNKKLLINHGAWRLAKMQNSFNSAFCPQKCHFGYLAKSTVCRQREKNRADPIPNWVCLFSIYVRTRPFGQHQHWEKEENSFQNIKIRTNKSFIYFGGAILTQNTHSFWHSLNSLSVCLLMNVNFKFLSFSFLNPF